MRFAFTATCVLLLSGCSLIFAHGPPGGHEMLDHFDCNSNLAAPATDAFFGGTYLLATLIFAAAGSDNSDGDRIEGVALAGALSAGFLGSMVYGFLECRECAKAKDQLRTRQLVAERAQARQIADLQRQLELARQPLQLAPAAPIVAPGSVRTPAAPSAAPAAPAQTAPAPSPAAEPAAPALP